MNEKPQDLKPRTKAFASFLSLSPREARAGREPERGAADQTLHLTPTLSPNSVGREGESIFSTIDKRSKGEL
jgi:hypothetical protein